MAEDKQGVVHGDGVAIMLMVLWAMFLLYYVANGGPLSPINGATTAQTNFGTAYTNMKWFMYVLVPVVPYLMIKGWEHQNKKVDEEE